MQVETLSDPCCTTGVDVISLKILKNTLIGEEVVEEGLMALPYQLSSQRLHNSRSKVVLGCVTLLPIIYFKPREVLCPVYTVSVKTSPGILSYPHQQQPPG